MPMYNLREYSNNYSKTSGSLQHYQRDESYESNGAIVDFPADSNNSALFKFKTKIAGTIGNNGRKEVKIRVPFKYLSNFLEGEFLKCH